MRTMLFSGLGLATAGVTAGHQSATVKDNRQLPENSPEAHELGEMIVTALERNPLFITAALPLRVFPPLFNRYEGGEAFGAHLDNSIRQIPARLIGFAPIFPRRFF